MAPRKGAALVFPTATLDGLADERYLLLVLYGPSKTGKSSLAKSLYGVDRTLVLDCQHATVPDLKEYQLGFHRCIVFDEMAEGAALIVGNKKLMQAHSDGAKVRSVILLCAGGAVKMRCLMQTILPAGGAVRYPKVCLGR